MAFSGQSGVEADGERDRPQELVAAARLLADETGSAAFTVAQLTSRAGVSLKAFYASFRSKDDLLLALLAEDSRIGAEVLAERIGDRTGPDGLRAYVVELFAMLTLPGAIGYAGVLVRERRRLIESHDDELRDALAPLVDLLARHIDTQRPEARRAHDVRGPPRGHQRHRRRAASPTRTSSPSTCTASARAGAGGA